MTLTLNGRNIQMPKPRRGEKYVHKVLGARYNKNLGHYSLPATSLNVLRLVDNFGEEILEGAPEIIRDLAHEPWGFKGFTMDEAVEAGELETWEKLYNYQKLTVSYLMKNPHGAGLGVLTPGLGKTAIAVTAARLLGYRRVLVLTLPTLGPAWISELSAWWPQDTPGIVRAIRDDKEPGDEWTVAHSQILREPLLKDENGEVHTIVEWGPDLFNANNARMAKAWIEDGPSHVNKKGKFEKSRKRIYRARRSYLQPWDLVIVDESVLYKSRDAVRSELLQTLVNQADCDVWELSGFPTTRGRQDLFKQLQIMDPKAFSSYWRFVEFMCVVDKEGWGWTIEEDAPGVDPAHYLRDYMIVFSQEDVLPELPEYIYWRLPVEPLEGQRKALDEMMEDWKTELEKGEGPVEADVLLARTTRLAQITSNLGSVPKPSGKGFHKPGSAKEELLVELIKGEQIETPLLVWVWYIETAKQLHKRLQKEFGKKLIIQRVTGELSTEENDLSIQGYKDGEVDILILQQGIGKYGHTFTDTKTVFYHDRAYDLDAWVQSLRRVRRIGLEHRPVLVIPEMEDSFDQWVEEYLEEKLPSAAELTRSHLANLLARSLDSA